MNTRTLRQPPPRQIDLWTSLVMLTGGFGMSFGLFFIAIGSLFVWIMGSESEAMFWFEGSARWMPLQATVNLVEPTNMSENDVVIFRHQYSYELDWNVYQGEAYDLGSRYQPGDKIPIEFQDHDPAISRAIGMRRAPFGGWIMALLLIFPFIGLAFVVGGVVKNLKLLRMLRNGAFSRAKLVDTQPTNTAINNQKVYQYTFAFEVGGHSFKASCKTHQGAAVTDEDTEIVLYDPYDPAQNIVYDAYPQAPTIGHQGQLLPPPLKQAWPLLFLMVVVFENILLWRMLG